MAGISVIIPTFRRIELLARCLRALAAQTHRPFEILVCDDAACPRTRDAVLRFSRQAPVPVSYLSVTGTRGPAGARNRGWRNASYEVLAFTDDDCIPEPDWLQQGIAALRGHVAAAGRLIVPLPAHPTDYQLNESGLERAEFVTANCFCRKAALDQVAGFDERFTAAWREDSDLQFRLLPLELPDGSCGIARAESAVVIHPVRSAKWGTSLFLQRKTMFDALLYKKHRELYRRKIARAPLLYYGAAGSLLAAAAFAGCGRPRAARASLSVWFALSLLFCAKRLKSTAKTPAHIAEMAVTSLAIPPLSLFWRLAGSLRFRVLFF